MKVKLTVDLENPVFIEKCAAPRATAARLRTRIAARQSRAASRQQE
jgi:hypothetical protein